MKTMIVCDVGFVHVNFQKIFFGKLEMKTMIVGDVGVEWWFSARRGLSTQGHI